VSRVVYVGGELEEVATAFADAGFQVGKDVLLVEGDATEPLAAADARGVKYVLVHVGPDDGAPAGSFARAHHRVAAADLPGLARKLRGRERMLVRVVAFGYKHGLPPAADWVVDARFLDNPYWVEELRPLTGQDAAVRRHVLAQPAAGELLDNLVRTIGSLLPAYRAQGREELTVAFGCTGGRHRSVVLAGELARRLEGGEVDVETEYREL
jgi:P-loop ATPase protein family